MRIGFIATRLAGTDGVSLEVEKWTRVLQRLGHEVFFCAGELDGYASDGVLIPELHFQHEHVFSITKRAFDEPPDAPAALMADIRALAEKIRPSLTAFIRGARLDLIIVENAFAIPMNLPLGLCLAEIIEDSGIKTIAHNHDFFWERERYQAAALLDFLDVYFPPDLPGIRHVTINSIAQNWLKARRGIESVVVPNVHDFDTLPHIGGEYTSDVRRALDLREREPFILQPTRVIRRKGIEMALLLVQSLDIPNPLLFITHSATDEGLDYWHWLSREAGKLGVEIRKVDDLVASRRNTSGGRKLYTLWDIYPHADLVTYPSLYEGFGNALLEAVYYRRPVVVNRYPVYNADIKLLGFDFIEIDGFVSEEAVAKTKNLLNDPALARLSTQNNYQIAWDHFSFEVLERKLKDLLTNF